MSYSSFIALRYLKGRRRHTPISLNTIISIGGVALGVMALIVVLSVMSGFENDLMKKILGTNSPIIVSSFNDKGITDYNQQMKKIQEVPHVVSVAPFTYSEVMLTSPSSVSGIILKGVDPASIGKVTELSKTMVAGSISGLNTAGPVPGILLGRELAANLGVRTGERVRVVSPFGTITPLGVAPKFQEFVVMGLFDTGMYEYDSKLAYISIPVAQKFFGLGDSVTGFEVRIDDLSLSAPLAKTIQNHLGFPLRARDWMQMNRSLFSALKLEKITMFVILVLIIIVASFNIVSTLIMIVIDKAREIAILKSMGATRAGIMKIFMINGTIIGVVGTLIGLAGGLAVCFIIEKTNLITLPSDIYYISHLPARVDPWNWSSYAPRR